MRQYFYLRLLSRCLKRTTVGSVLAAVPRCVLHDPAGIYLIIVGNQVANALQEKSTLAPFFPSSGRVSYPGNQAKNQILKARGKCPYAPTCESASLPPPDLCL